VSVALVTQHAERMRPIIVSSAACPGVPHVSTLYRKRLDFVCVCGGGIYIEHLNVCVDFLCNFCPKHFSF